MTYPYNEHNLLETPQKYMYTSFQGIALIQSYLDNRRSILSLCEKGSSKTLSSSIFMKKAFAVIELILLDKSPSIAKSFCPQLKQQTNNNFNSNSEDDLQLKQMVEAMNNLSHSKVVTTSNLINGLVASLLLEKTESNSKVWLDRVVQRFEVSKKLYDEYQPGFRKGQGENRTTLLYWSFALALCLYYLKTNQLKYLSTLIKVNDLLTSLPLEELSEVIPTFGMELVLSTEIVFVSMLADAKGIKNASR